MSTATAARYYRFELLVGRHIQGGKSKHRDSNGVVHQEIPGQVYNKGDVFITPTDLRKLDQPGMPPKFRFISEATEEEWERQQGYSKEGPEQEKPKLKAPFVQDGLNDLTISELMDLAKTTDKDVDLSGLSRKPEIVQALRAAGVTATS